MQSRLNANWQIHNVEHSASEMHSRDLPAERGIWNVKISRSALVLGSSQTEEVVNLEACAKAKVEVVHRRSGGGAVYLAMGEHLWVDVVVPRGDELWNDDVVASSQWIGDVWSRVLTTLGGSLVSVHRGRAESSTWSKLVCFAGVGPGEVSINGHKAVGISQRRTNKAARFQCFVHRRWTPEIFLSLLTPPQPSVGELAELVATIDHDPTRLFDSFVDEVHAL